MKAIRIHERGGPEVLRYEDAPVPKPGAGEILVRVHAAGVTHGELEWFPTWFTRLSQPRPFPVTPGHEFAGEVVEIGENARGVAVGDQVFGLSDWFCNGALAEYCITRPDFVIPRPDSIDVLSAAITPISALTAWQGLIHRGRLASGNRVLIHGGAGGVGQFAVQIARWRGAHVIATCSSHNESYVREIGAHETIDYHTVNFESVVSEVDLVLDTVGGETLNRSWQVLAPGGRLVTISNDAMTSKDLRVREASFIVEPDRTQLEDLTGWIVEGILKPVVDRVLPLSRAREAYETKGKRGKSVVQIAQPPR
ncbi:MAG TPA: NADP-dependent oxidoreductase [Candidatus Limnocylindrales bacterium]|nr:NADP-dependent oxidoreductase [Candidatus Limnocylindrales bacterium]